MSKKKEFEDDLKRIKDIYFSAQETFLINKELYKNIKSSEYESYLKSINPFFYFCKIYFWRNTVLELSKLFNQKENEKFNIPKFVSKLKPNGYFKSLNFDAEFLETILIRIENNKHLIDNLIEQRDKVYAHEDRNNQDVKNLVSHTQTEQLLEIVKDLIKELYQVHYETSMQFDILASPATSLENIIEKLCTVNVIEEKERSELFKKMTE